MKWSETIWNVVNVSSLKIHEEINEYKYQSSELNGKSKTYSLNTVTVFNKIHILCILLQYNNYDEGNFIKNQNKYFIISSCVNNTRSKSIKI